VSTTFGGWEEGIGGEEDRVCDFGDGNDGLEV
jgi:hypothetical protein